MKKNIINKGCFLISIPLIGDNRFDKTIIIITNSLKKEKIGFIINKRVNHNLSDLVDKIKIKSIKVNYGGPVCSDNLFYFHKNPTIENCKKINSNLYLGGNFNQITEYLNCKLIKPDEIFFCLGYCGWGEMQLEKEINENSWVISNKKIDFINKSINWEKEIIEIDEKYKLWVKSNRNYHFN